METGRKSETSTTSTKSPQKQPHPLHTSWIFYANELPQGLMNDPEAKHEGHRIRCLGKCSTVEEFWKEYKKTEKPSDLRYTEGYYLMRDPLDPQWEKAEHSGGGRWRLRNTNAQNADYLWYELAMGAVGEKLGALIDSSNTIVGVGVSPRPSGVVIEIWTSSIDFEASEPAGFAKRFNEMLPQQLYFKLVYYESFDEIKKKAHSK